MTTLSYATHHLSQRTGLSPHRIRAWERRYQAIVPERSKTQRRLYSEADVRRMQLLRRAVSGGQRIFPTMGGCHDDLT